MGLRQALTRADRAGPVAIQGLLGIGKTQLAVEYAYRYSYDYDLVWWVPGDDDESARSAMDDLAGRLELSRAPRAPTESSYGELFDQLRRDQHYERWLLIFDNVTDPERIKDLIPPLSGDVLVTTRSSRWEASGYMLELDAFDRAESIEFLRRRMRTFHAVSAHRLAEAVGDLPLLLEHAVESRDEISAYLARLDRDPLALLDDQPADYHATVAGEWQAVLSRLRADADALDLLQCLAFFGSNPVPRESLERASYLGDVSVREMLHHPFRRIGAITKLRRAGLLKVGPDTGSLALHQVTRRIVRYMVAASGPGSAERARHDVHLLLAAADPLAPDDPATWRTYEELNGHAAESSLAACSHEMVRKLVVNLVRFHTATGDPQAALSLADRALAGWAAASGEDGTLADESGVAIRMAKADALFAYGKRDEAFWLRSETLAPLRSDPQRWAAEITNLEGMAGARLRVTGEFREALAADQESVAAHTAVFGADDPRTFAANDYLIADLALVGAASEAAEAASAAYRDYLAFYSDAGHPAVLAARNVLGRCLWLSGEYETAFSNIRDVHSRYETLAGAGILDDDHPWRLQHEIDYAIARRDKGLISAELPGLAVHLQDVRRRCWRTLGPDHPQTLAAAVVLGSILRRVTGRAGEAVRVLRDAERRYHAALPGHAYGAASTSMLAAMRGRVAGGSGQRAAAQSVPVIQEVLDQLAGSVGECHPLSLTAASALANALARADELDDALKFGQEAQAGFQALFGPHHPHSLAAEANTTIIQARLGHGDPSQGLAERYATQLGPGHPDLARFAQEELIDIDFTPLPL